MSNVDTYHLEPGFVFVSINGAVIRTVLGSCVAVCLWDEKRKFGGMNHFLYPITKDKTKATAQYGNVAIPTLIKLMNKQGSTGRDMVAQMFGGGKLHDSSTNRVGEENVEVAKRILQSKRIPLVSEDVGGKMGRKILFDTNTGHIVTLKVKQLRDTDWIEHKENN